MKFHRLQRPRDEPEINLVPLIDVLLVLLIFLTATTTFTRFGELGIQLPAAAQAGEAPAPEIGITVFADGRYLLDGQPQAAGVQALAQALRTAAGGRPDSLVVVYADAQANHQSVVDVMQAARLAGLARLSFGTRQSAP
ncbi:biopolymer transporter ExbD [Verticiella sediminum]|uniref:Biopolymer transporter ExbD n=1 Tax=Verticiella sediminum TaxID=1247510 RepID=A0A556AC23_9BURK|nr:biopolymer transporter ExbD [Verticiella sediminum]TSH90434.1 biopolymer transporter ExbD [Verticiella sediminum]